MGEDPHGAEKRRHAREAVTLVVEYEGADDLVGDFTDNLSSGGTFVHTPRDFEIGTIVHLVLSFPGLIQPIRIDGVVRWARAETGAGGADDEERGVGIEFADGPARDQLHELIDRITARDPSVVSRLMRVLVVEDNPHVAQLIRDGLRGSEKRTFQDMAFNFRTASNGSEALELLQAERFDALIIDVYLPVLDGPAVIQKIREDERTRALPIIAVSAGGDSARDAARGAGANFFLHKPMRLRQIIDTMQQLVTINLPPKS
jgi:uncharacterized protein (TIGR02266 family)